MLPLECTIQLDTWPCLKVLNLISCLNTQSMLSEFSTPKLNTFVFQDNFFKQEQYGTEEEKLLTLSSMICRFSTLETLDIDVIGVQRSVAEIRQLIRSVTGHSRNLRCLSFLCGPGAAEVEDDIGNNFIFRASRSFSCRHPRRKCTQTWQC